MDHITVTEAVRQQLEALCLNSFPCSTGSWNKSHQLDGKKPSADTYWEDSDQDLETQDTLHDLLNQPGSPWEPNDKFNSEVQHLKELAAQYPENLTNQFIYSYFKQLRVVDKEVTEVDAQLLKFQNLEELVLSANKLKTVDSGNLPKKLKILELCSNHISSLKDLSINPPPLLQHLGLAYNRIQCSTESLFLAADIWPNLVSLDLSFNDLTDLFTLVSPISTLQNLRILTLQGNPLTFITSYRGYTIDCLPKLCVLDDILILPDEKYKFSGLSKKKEVLENKAKFYVHIGKVKGIPNPHTEQQLSGDYPVTTVTYYVCYEVLEDQPSSDMQESPPYMCNQLQQMTTEGPVQLNPLNLHTGLYKSIGSVWNETIEYEYAKEHTSSDLLCLKSFFLCGMNVTIVEEKERKTDGKNKKKKENLIELRHEPPILKILGSAVMPLQKLVSGEMQTFSICNLEPLYNNLEHRDARDKSPQNSNKTKERKTKSGRENAESPKTPRSLSGKEKRKDAENKPTEESPPLMALSVEISVQLAC
ncbi:leucine-rich repeat-containing protein 43 isoform 2-T2 [Anomaloglossus baeobatrachus]|uniref:leucine-rich repeat-containing protein 43 isoform X2 n=1 Tax=Anomaloglossus baeobatrachus TaxID=238106 RepID=UPI003F508E0E